MTDFITNPVIGQIGTWKPKFYWTGEIFEDAERINRPHIKAEGGREDRIQDTIDILSDLNGFLEITLTDAFNIQNRLLQHNNWKGIKPGLRTHSVNISTVDFTEVEHYIKKLFPVTVMPKDHMLEWYRQVQTVHPLSDLNGRVFGIIVSVLYSSFLKTKK